jgi:hydrogenase expression/formation protein HypC
MCLGIPGQIIETYQTNGLKMGKIDFGGVTREICLEYVPEAQIGDYALVHVGFALNLISELEAQETIELIQQIAEFDEEIGSEEINPAQR